MFETEKEFPVAKTLTFLHTSPVHVATFDRLLTELAPDVPVRHMVDEGLLQDARAFGMTPDLTNRIRHTVDTAIADGAAVVVCTCSTLGCCVEQVQQSRERTVMRIDRPMAERAVAIGGRILVAAALTSTLAPTRQLLLDVAQQTGKTINLTDVLCDGAWPHFERGDYHSYLTVIANDLRQAAPKGDVIILAQASMADAAFLCADLSIPILSSPRLGLEAALVAYRAAS